MVFLKALLPLILFAGVAPCMAQTDIHRCIDASGHALFTDQSCAAMQATAVKPAAKSGPGTPGVAPPAPAEPQPILCAATFNKLRQSVIDAFANHNPNRMAGLMLWNGYGSQTAVANIRSLSALMQQPLLDAGPPSGADKAADDSLATPGTEQDDEASAGTNALVVRLAGNDGSGNPRELHYDVVRRYGCLWLRAGG